MSSSLEYRLPLDTPGRIARPDEVLELRELRREITAALESLWGNLESARDTECLRLRFDEDLTISEIAEQMGRSRERARQRINRALRHLRSPGYVRLHEAYGRFAADERARDAVRARWRAEARAKEREKNLPQLRKRVQELSALECTPPSVAAHAELLFQSREETYGLILLELGKIMRDERSTGAIPPWLEHKIRQYVEAVKHARGRESQGFNGAGPVGPENDARAAAAEPEPAPRVKSAEEPSPQPNDPAPTRAQVATRALAWRVYLRHKSERY